MIDLKLTVGDIGTTDGDLDLVAGAACVQQALTVGHKLFRGEDYRDEEAGIPYYTHILVNAPRTTTIEAIFRQDILSDGYVEALRSFSMSVNKRLRKLTVQYEAVSTEGEVSVSEVFP